MSDLQKKLEEAKAEVARLEAEIRKKPCHKVGHVWKHIGGANAGCCNDCVCSVPVYTCEKCGDSDYGNNSEAEEIRKDCREMEMYA